jgi:hypothetical protein
MAPRWQGYHIVALRRGEWPAPWVWEIFHRGKPLEAGCGVAILKHITQQSGLPDRYSMNLRKR